MGRIDRGANEGLDRRIFLGAAHQSHIQLDRGKRQLQQRRQAWDGRADIDARQAGPALELNGKVTGVDLASFANAAREAYLHRGGKPVAEGFSYSSDTNPEQLDARGLQNLLAMAYA